ncbi:MAG: hypothetical protein SGJ02_01330 [bacterium]|nr:hypothetical protein [bacterium]
MISKFQVTLTKKRSLIFWNWEIKYNATTQLDTFRAGTVLDCLVKNLIPVGLFANQPISDLSGSLENSGDTQPLLKINGRLLVSEQHWQNFTASLETKFSSFEGIHHIKHIGIEKKSNSLPDFINVKRLGRLIPIEIQDFSLGLSIYKSKYTMILGYAPTALETLSIKYNNGELSIQILAEQLKSKEELPLLKAGLLKNLDKVLKELFDFSITKSLNSQGS